MLEAPMKERTITKIEVKKSEALNMEKRPSGVTDVKMAAESFVEQNTASRTKKFTKQIAGGY